MKENPRKFGEKLKAHREKMGVSGWQIEKETGYLRSNVSSIEAGRVKPSIEFLEKLSKMEALQIDFETLKAWKAMDDYGEDVLRAAYRMLEANKTKTNNAGQD